MCVCVGVHTQKRGAFSSRDVQSADDAQKSHSLERTLTTLAMNLLELWEQYPRCPDILHLNGRKDLIYNMCILLRQQKSLRMAAEPH